MNSGIKVQMASPEACWVLVTGTALPERRRSEGGGLPLHRDDPSRCLKARHIRSKYDIYIGMG